MIDKDSSIVDPHAQLTSMLETMGIELLLRTLIDVVEERAVPNEPDDDEGAKCYFSVEPLRDVLIASSEVKPNLE